MNKKTYDDINETVYSKVLDNGLHVALLPRPEMSKTYALFTTNYGSIDQRFTPANSDEFVEVPHGIAHFLEHKLFEKEDGDVFADFGKQGASANAYTSFTKTAYLFSATNQIEKNVETLLDFVQEPYFTEDTVEKEKGIIEQEILMYDDEPGWQSFMGIVKSMFSEHPVNIDIAGTVDEIRTITKDDLYTCYNTFYHPENMLFFMIGNFDPEEMMAFVEKNQQAKRFTPIDPIQRSYPDEPVSVNEKERTIHMPVSIPKSVVGVKYTSDTTDPVEFVKEDLLQSMLLDYICSESGPYYEDLYENDYIDNSFSYSATLEQNFGFTMISTNSREPEKFVEKMQASLLEAGQMRLDEDTFSMIKKKTIGDMLRGMNSLEYIANQFTHYHFLGVDFLTVHRIVEELTVDEAHAFLQKWLDEEHMASVIIRPES